MRVEDIIAAAGVSRRTFYNHFRDKQEAFLAAYDAGVKRILDMFQNAIAAYETFPAQVRAGLAAYLEFAAAEPAVSNLCVVEILAAGPQAVERRNMAMRTAAAILHAVGKEGTDSSRSAPPLAVAEVVVGGVTEVIYSRLVSGEAVGLPELHQDLAYSIMLPYLGPEAAAREAAEPPVARSASGAA